MDIRDIFLEMLVMCETIDIVQDGWDGMCNCTECYWNMFHPTLDNGVYNNDESKICVSESITELKMTPNNSLLCQGYLNYIRFCGCNKDDRCDVI